MKKLFVLILFFTIFINPTLSFAEDTSLKLKAEYTFKYYLFKVYTVKLFLPSNIENKDVLSDVPKRLKFTYHREIEGEILIEKGDESLKRNPNFSFDKYKKELSLINENYNTVNDGDSYILEYFPTKGLTLYNRKKGSSKNTELVTVKGSEFAKFYFGIWLSEYALGKGVYKALVLSD